MDVYMQMRVSAFITFQNNVCGTLPQWLHNGPNNVIHDVHILYTFSNVVKMENHSANIQIENTVQIVQWTSMDAGSTGNYYMQD